MSEIFKTGTKNGDALLNDKKHDVSASDSNELLCCDDVEFLRKTVESLWQIVDDIDTMGDIAKADDKFYRARVEKYQARRWKLGIDCDGYKLIIK